MLVLWNIRMTEGLQAFIAELTSENINLVDENGFSLLHFAVLHKDSVVVNILLADKHLNLNQLAYGHIQPLYIAKLLNWDHDVVQKIAAKASKLYEPSVYCGAGELENAIIAKNVAYVNMVFQNKSANRWSFNEIPPLHAAVYHFNKEILQKLCEQWPEKVDQLSDRGTTPLWEAFYGGNVDAINILLAHGANLTLMQECRDRHGYTLLHRAVLDVKTPAIELILKHYSKSDISVTTPKEVNALYIAKLLNYESRESLRDVFKKINDQTVAEDYRETAMADSYPWEYAIRTGNEALIDELLKSKSDYISSLDVDTLPLLHLAVRHTHENNKSILNKICQYNSEKINQYDSKQRTPLYLAVDLNNTVAVDILLNHNADLTITNNSEWTPLFAAVRKGALSTVERLLADTRTNPDFKHPTGSMAIHLAACGGHIDVVKRLLQNLSFEEKEKLINNGDCKGISAFHTAVYSKNKALMEYLLTNGANVNAVSLNGMTALYIASNLNQAAMVESLVINHHANTRMAHNNRTPLHVAATEGFREIVDLLLPYSDISQEFNALYFACQNGHIDVANLLIQKGAPMTGHLSIESLNLDNTLLHIAVMGNHFDLVSSLLSALLEDPHELNKQNIIGDTPLHIACKKGNLNIVNLILQYKADLNVKNFKDYTPLHIAVENKHLSIIKVLLRSNPGLIESYGTSILTDAILNNQGDLVQCYLECGIDPFIAGSIEPNKIPVNIFKYLKHSIQAIIGPFVIKLHDNLRWLRYINSDSIFYPQIAVMEKVSRWHPVRFESATNIKAYDPKKKTYCHLVNEKTQIHYSSWEQQNKAGSSHASSSMNNLELSAVEQELIDESMGYKLQLMSSLDEGRTNAEYGVIYVADGYQLESWTTLTQMHDNVVYINEQAKTYRVKGMKQDKSLPDEIDTTNLTEKIKDLVFTKTVLTIACNAGAIRSNSPKTYYMKNMEQEACFSYYINLNALEELLSIQVELFEKNSTNLVDEQKKLVNLTFMVVAQTAKAGHSRSFQLARAPTFWSILLDNNTVINHFESLAVKHNLNDYIRDMVVYGPDYGQGSLNPGGMFKSWSNHMERNTFESGERYCATLRCFAENINVEVDTSQQSRLCFDQALKILRNQLLSIITFKDLALKKENISFARIYRYVMDVIHAEISDLLGREAADAIQYQGVPSHLMFGELSDMATEYKIAGLSPLPLSYEFELDELRNINDPNKPHIIYLLKGGAYGVQDFFNKKNNHYGLLENRMPGMPSFNTLRGNPHLLQDPDLQSKILEIAFKDGFIPWQPGFEALGGFIYLSRDLETYFVNGMSKPMSLSKAVNVADLDNKLRAFNIKKIPFTITLSADHTLTPQSVESLILSQEDVIRVDQLYLAITNPAALVEQLYHDVTNAAELKNTVADKLHSLMTVIINLDESAHIITALRILCRSNPILLEQTSLENSLDFLREAWKDASLKLLSRKRSNTDVSQDEQALLSSDSDFNKLNICDSRLFSPKRIQVDASQAEVTPDQHIKRLK